MRAVCGALLLLGACAEVQRPATVVLDEAPDFSLEDVNPTSSSFGDVVSPRDKLGEVSVWYFGHADCPLCQSNFSELDRMREQLASDGYAIEIIGINAIGKEASNQLITDGRDLPWLQDTEDDKVWSSWLASWRDLVVLDANNELAWRDNLTDHDIRFTDAYDDIYQRIVETGD